MVKFKLPGNDRAKFRICGHYYTGGVVYNNDKCKLPLKEIEMFVVDDGKKKKDVKEVKKAKVEEPEVKAEPEVKEEPEDNEALKKHLKDSMTVKELKAVAKERELKGYSVMNEAALVDALVENGYKG